jgi:hypothetical protein
VEKTAYKILVVLAFCWLIAIIVGMIEAFPFGILGLVAILAFGLLFIKALKERLANLKNDRYSKDVDK